MSSEHLPVIKNGELSKKKLTGKLVLRGGCPTCGAALSLSEEEVLRRKDSCPDCRAPFVVGLPEFKKVQTLHAAVEEAKQQAIRASEEVAEEKRRVAKEQAEVFQRQRVAAAEKMRVAKEQEAVSSREKANVERESSVNDLPRMAMEEGIQGSDEKFPNIPRALAMWESIVGVSMVAGGLALFGAGHLWIGCIERVHWGRFIITVFSCDRWRHIGDMVRVRYGCNRIVQGICYYRGQYPQK